MVPKGAMGASLFVLLGCLAQTVLSQRRFGTGPAAGIYRGILTVSEPEYI